MIHINNYFLSITKTNKPAIKRCQIKLAIELQKFFIAQLAWVQLKGDLSANVSFKVLRLKN